MRKFVLLFTLVSFLGSYELFGQGDEIRPLEIGDPIPDLKFELHKGDSIGNAKISQFRGKVVILDFWSSSCLDCVLSMPRLLDLQKRMGDKIQIVVVTGDNSKDINRLLKTWSSWGHGDFSYCLHEMNFIIGDTMLTRMFPAGAGIPMHVWIDTSGKYMGSAYENSTTGENIVAASQGKKVELAKYYQPDLSGRQLDGWLDKRIGFRDHLLDYYFITKFDERIATYGKTEIVKIDSKTNQVSDLTMFNASIVELYKMAYFSDTKLKIDGINKKVVDKSEMSGRMHPPPNHDTGFYKWREQNLYCYAAHNSGRDGDVFKDMQTRLDRFFGLKSKLETIPMKCLVLKNKADKMLKKSTKQTPLFNDVFHPEDSSREFICNRCKLSYVTDKIYNDYVRKNDGLIFINEASCPYYFDVDIVWGEDNYSLNRLKARLNQIGLDFSIEYRMQPVVVLRDKN